MNHKRFLCLLRLICLATVVLLGLPPAPAGAQMVAAQAAQVITPTMQLKIPPPRVRTWQEMEAAAAIEAAGPPPPPRLKAFLPTMDAATYKAFKAQAAQKAPATSAAPQGPLAPLASTILTNPINFDGIDSVTAGNLRPPDTHGAAGPNHFVEITNSHLDIYQKAAPNTHVGGLSLNAFFGYTNPVVPSPSLFDPRVIYDSVAGRWIMTADAFPESTTVQRMLIAVSAGTDPTDLPGYLIYDINVIDGVPNTFWDFPQLGMDQNAIIITANLFQGQPPNIGKRKDTRMFAVAKSQLYKNNGPNPVTLTPHLFTGLTGTLAPPIVLDANPNTYLVAAPSSGSSISLYTMTNSAGNPPSLSGPLPMTVPTYIAPANAPQPGTAALLDTGDARFVNASTQVGDSLFQAHSISLTSSFGGAICRFYEFDTGKKTVIQHGDFSSSGTSFDFNVSIAANRHKDVFVTWSSTDTGVNAEARFSGRLHTDPAGVISSPSSLLAGSNTFYSYPGDDQLGERWGDYSAVSLDPADPSGATAWIVNERILRYDQINGNSFPVWGSRISRIRLPAKIPGAIYLLLLGD